MDKCKFSVIVVCLNPGDKLPQTVNSILRQDFDDYEIVVKDGGSTDGSLQKLPAGNHKIRMVIKADTGIYDAMNQAVGEAKGEYVLFLNCGDTFPDSGVLQKAAGYMEENGGHGIYYGDTFCEKTGVRVASPREITAFACYRNIPCHQSCFYLRELFTDKKYEPAYRVRADYEHFLWCFFRAGVKPAYMDMVVANYEGGGYSESRDNKKRDKEEHRLITKKYLSGKQLFLYGLFMVVTLRPLRSFLAETTAFSGIYNKLKGKVYR